MGRRAGSSGVLGTHKRYYVKFTDARPTSRRGDGLGLGPTSRGCPGDAGPHPAPTEYCGIPSPLDACRAGASCPTGAIRRRRLPRPSAVPGLGRGRPRGGRGDGRAEHPGDGAGAAELRGAPAAPDGGGARRGTRGPLRLLRRPRSRRRGAGFGRPHRRAARGGCEDGRRGDRRDHEALQPLDFENERWLEMALFENRRYYDRSPPSTR